MNNKDGPKFGLYPPSPVLFCRGHRSRLHSFNSRCEHNRGRGKTNRSRRKLAACQAAPPRTPRPPGACCLGRCPRPSQNVDYLRPAKAGGVEAGSAGVGPAAWEALLDLVSGSTPLGERRGSGDRVPAGAGRGRGTALGASRRSRRAATLAALRRSTAGSRGIEREA
ncbi:hypothetical protein NDU88_002989 [Pleurodeles waltl]|uniref:Uncharacterized protein n=1 Tax=Pleurodeles waltl TaxID=8319 RepID=A0AAV7Q8I0_PLEWA|nr:hypothetical protein NDU88_002989 [Pleurodeles waltl]